MMSNIFNLRQETLHFGVFVGVMLVLVSAAMSREALELLTGLVGAFVVYMLKEHSSSGRARVAKPIKTPALDSQAVGLRGVSRHKTAVPVRTLASKAQAVAPSGSRVQRIVPRLHHAEPRTELYFADKLTLCEQVDQLLCDTMPAPVDCSVCEELLRMVTPCIKKLVPEALIEIIAHSSLVRIGRTGFRPEVDLLVTVPPEVLAKRLLIHMQENAGDHSVRKLDKIMEVDESTLHKYATRAVSATLSFCKLWRTAYRGVEPKVVLLAPRCLGVLSEDMHIHVYVNCPNTIRSREVFNQSECHVQKLIAFVRRWAQDRCIANTAYGHMPLYAWSLFVKYFCQCGEDIRYKASTIELFGKFVDFYINQHDSLGQAHIESAWQIEDPYDIKRNVAECMTSVGMKRFREELDRAKMLLESKATLLTILEHCNPLPPGVRHVPESALLKRQESSAAAALGKSSRAEGIQGDDLLSTDAGDSSDS